MGGKWHALASAARDLDACHDVREIVCDDSGGNRAVRALEESGLKVRTCPEHAAACSKFLDLVAEQGFRHIGQLELLAALRGAKGVFQWAGLVLGPTTDVHASPPAPGASAMTRSTGVVSRLARVRVRAGECGRRTDRVPGSDTPGPDRS
jgi:hypothetical protein